MSIAVKLGKQSLDVKLPTGNVDVRPPFIPSDVASVKMWLDNPAISGNVIEDGAQRVSEWTGEIGGINADQTTGADQPLRVVSELQFDGSSEFFDLPDLFTLASGDTQGELFFILKTGADGIIDAYKFVAADGATSNNYFAININATSVAGEHRIDIVHLIGLTTVSVRGDTDIGEDQVFVLNVSSNGTRWRARINNGTDETLADIDNTNNGNWIGDVVGVDNIRFSGIGRSVPIFAASRYYSAVYSNAELAEIDRTSIIDFLNNRIASISPIF